MSINLDASPFVGQLPTGRYQKSTTFYTIVLLSVQAFQLLNLIFGHLVAFVAQQQNTKLVFFKKLLMARRRIRAYADNDCVALLNLGQLFAKIDRLSSTPTRVVFRIEVYDNPFAFEIA